MAALLTPVLMLLLLSAPYVLSFGASRLRGTRFDGRPAAAAGLALLFVFTGLGHFMRTEEMAGMLPSWVPARHALILATGVLELGLASALLWPRSRRTAGEAAIVLFIAFFPANIYASLARHPMGGGDWGPLYLLIRAPLQAVLVAWAWFLIVRKVEPAPHA